LGSRLTQPPEGLDAFHCDVWHSAVKAQQELGTWKPSMRVLTDEYVWALEAARDARLNGKGAEWDRCCRRASMLADQLGLTARGRKAAGADKREDDGDEFDGLAPVRALRSV